MNQVKTKNNLKKNILLFNRKGETRIYLFLSFLLPFLIMWYFFYKSKVHPFGDQQILVTDLWHQYYPFFRVEHEKLQNLSSFLYSWESGMGTNFIALMSYYAASPLNLLAVFFPIEYSREALTLFLTVKIGCAGLFFAIFLKHVFNKNDISLPAFALCFALCNFIMGYYWNIIWMDTVALLPLVVLGTVKLYKEGKYKLYIISLALSLITSYYIGLFICIFTVMVFAGLVIIDWKGFGNFFKRLGQIIGATAIGIGIGAFILLPAYFALMLTNSANNQFPTEITYYETWFKMISSAIGFHPPTEKEGLPNFYCGMFAIALLGVYLRSFKIKFREKFITVGYLVFIVISCNMNVLNYMWHGFHFTNMLPYRFSFLFSFILLAAGYRAFTVLKEEASIFDNIAMVMMTALIAGISFKNQTDKAVISSVIVCLVFVAVTLFHNLKIVKNRKINDQILNFAVFAVCFVEMGMNASLGVKTVTVTSYSNYPRSNTPISVLLDNIDETDKDFYRLETTTNWTINDPALYGYRGVAQFSSMANVNMTNMMYSLGIDASAAGNRYYYNQNTAVFNMFMNLKYLLSVGGYSGDLTYLEPWAEMDNVTVFRNNHCLPIAFAADSGVTGYTGDSFIQFENQNELFKLATGIDEDVFVRIDVKDVGHSNLSVVKTGYGNYNYQYNSSGGGNDNAYLKYNFEIKEDGPVYATFDFSDIKNVKIKSENAILHTQNIGDYLTIFAAGDFKAGDIATFQADVEKDKSGRGSIYVYQLNREVFEKGYEKLSAGGLSDIDYSDTRISGKLTAQEDGVIYTSIPYDGGWKAYIDGRETEVSSIRDALVCIPVTAGEHTVELKYCPPGFAVGLTVTLVSLGLLAVIWILEPKFRKVRSTESAEETVPESGENSEPEAADPQPEEKQPEAEENPDEESGE